MMTKKQHGRLTDEQSTLAGRWMKLAYKVANEHVARHPCRRRYRDDAEQTACAALVKAAGCYDPHQGAFRPYARKIIERALCELSRREAARYAACKLIDYDLATFAVAPPSRSHAEQWRLDDDRECLREQLEDFIDALPRREKRLIQLLMFERLSLAAAAREFSPPLTKETARQTLARAVRRLNSWKLFHAILVGVE